MKIINMPPASALTLTDLLPVAQDVSSTPVTNKATGAQVKTITQTGITSGSAAPTGIIGEDASSLIVSGSAISLSSGSGQRIPFLSLGSDCEGEWDISGSVNFIITAGTVSELVACISNW
jgi:hypothetical protein